MDSHRIGRLHRILRQRAGLTQVELATRAGVGRWKIVKLEAGELAGMRFGEVDLCFAALDARLDVRAWHHGAAADRLLDERHAALVGRAVEMLRHYGWEVRVEVSFSDYGDRGSIDVLGWHPRRRALCVQEIKSELGAIEGTLRPFDVKYRLAPKVVRQRFGWLPSLMGRVLVLPEDRTARRMVDRHEAVLNTVLPARARELRSWMRDPRDDIAGIWFLANVGSANTKRNPSSIKRVRRPSSRSGRGV